MTSVEALDIGLLQWYISRLTRKRLASYLILSLSIVLSFVAMESKIKITRSRTAQNRTRKATSSTHPNLREVTKDPAAKRKTKKSDTDASSKKRPKRTKLMLQPGASGSTEAATNVEIPVHSIGLQTISCSRCRGLGHVPALCPDRSSDSTPEAVFCPHCQLTSRYENTTLKIDVKLCPAHIPAVVDAASHEKKDRIQRFLKKIDNMLDAGTALDDALRFMDTTAEKYYKFQKYVAE